MPIKSKHQAAWLAIHRPDLLKKWQAEDPVNISRLPEHVKKRKKR